MKEEADTLETVHLKATLFELIQNKTGLEKEREEHEGIRLADDNEIQQVVLNLLMNAEDAMLEADGGRKLSVKTSRRESVVEIAVADEGPGIPEENIDSVFDPFFTTKEVGKGTGLGLSICYGIVHDHHGVIRVESEKNHGATFVVELPLATESPETPIGGEPKLAVG